MDMDGVQALRFPLVEEMCTFEDARNIIAQIAAERLSLFKQHQEDLPLDQAVGRTSSNEILSPINTPTYDTALVEGYAVMRSQTANASPEAPIRLRVMGLMSPGDTPLVINDEIANGVVPCVEIMIGAAFPVARSSKRPLESIIPSNLARKYNDQYGNLYLEITTPPLSSFHKRSTASDFRKGDPVVEEGAIIVPKHIMALASVGITSIAVMRSLRVAVLSTGSELTPAGASPAQPGPFKIPDANGPYLSAALREMNMEVTYLGAFPDDVEVLTQCIGDQLQAGSYDAIISTGGLSSGRQDSIPTSVARLGGQTHFRYVAMRPGHPVLFASLPLDGVNIEHSSPNPVMRGQGFQDEAQSMHQEAKVAPAIFCLPGNPIASAVCFRFLVTPYLRALGGMHIEQAMTAHIAPPPPEYNSFGLIRRDSTNPPPLTIEGSPYFDIFRAGVIRSNEVRVSVEVPKERAQAKTSPFASSNCWVHIERGHEGLRAGDTCRVFPFCSPKN